MDLAVPLGAEERKVRAARRFGRIGLVITVAWLLAVPAFVVWTGLPAPGFTWSLAALYVVGLALHLWRIREHVTSLGRPASVPFVVVTSAVALALTLVGLASTWSGWIWGLVGGVLLGDVVSGMRARWIALWVIVATGTVLSLGLLITHQRDYGIPLPLWLGPAVAAFYVCTMWLVDVERLWWLKAVTDLDYSRRVAAELATARERLRLADDLHDILGHALEVVAFKSELASRLLDVDADRAKAEMEEVQRVARSSLTEVRALVRDARVVDLSTELAGARAVLDSAGIQLVVRGDPAVVTGRARSVLGRVLREAMTNVLRHADPRRCTIEIEVADGTARLRVVNDGVGPGTAGVGGTGLVALGRYLDEHSGRLDAGPGPDGMFHVDAMLPEAVR
ncbi:sensor histidine kinase [Pseudonocardia hispaniensis]|uniref:Sensor histidine kinase n=1 Tax=Pseudonocardia hispaniensis TaxID=904933 RepID=A0ABW1J583_9PSEU